MRAIIIGIGAAAMVVGVIPAFAAEDTYEHETVEKHSMKIETVPPPSDVIEEHSTTRQVEHTGVGSGPAGRRHEHSTSEEETTVEKRQTAPATVTEKRTTVEVPTPPTVVERTYEQTERK
jgi:hypothetical protein